MAGCLNRIFYMLGWPIDNSSRTFFFLELVYRQEKANLATPRKPWWAASRRLTWPQMNVTGNEHPPRGWFLWYRTPWGHYLLPWGRPLSVTVHGFVSNFLSSHGLVLGGSRYVSSRYPILLARLTSRQRHWIHSSLVYPSLQRETARYLKKGLKRAKAFGRRMIGYEKGKIVLCFEMMGCRT